MELEALLESTLGGMGYELVDLERAGRGLMRVFIDREGGITVDDCARVSNQLTHVFAVEGVDYERLEVSSPGLDRPLRTGRDFLRFAGEEARVRTRLPRAGQRSFTGVIRGFDGSKLSLDVGGEMLSFDLAEIDKARLVPKF